MVTLFIASLLLYHGCCSTMFDLYPQLTCEKVPLLDHSRSDQWCNWGWVTEVKLSWKGPLATAVDPLANTQKKTWEMMANPNVDGYIKTLNHWKAFGKRKKKQQWAENLKHKYKLGCVPDLHLTFQGVICPSAPIYIIGSDLVTLYFKSLSSV